MVWLPLSLCGVVKNKKKILQHCCTFLRKEKTHFQVAPSSCATCPGGSDASSGSKHYYAVTSARKWHEAEAACPPGTELASFKSTSEYNTFGGVFNAKREHCLESSFFFNLCRAFFYFAVGDKGWSAIYNPGAVTVGRKISYLFSMIFC